MNRWASAALCLTALTLTRSASADESDHDRLNKGELLIVKTAVAGSDYPEVWVRAVIEAPPERVWDIIDHCARYKDTLAHVKESHELSRAGTSVRCEVIISSPGPVKDLRSVTQAEHTVSPGRWVRSWKLEAGDYKVNVGSWILTRFDDNPARTLADYRFHTEPNIWVPGWVQSFALKHALPSLFEKLRAETRSP